MRREGEFHRVYDDGASADRFYLFLQNVFHLYAEDRLHTLIKHCCDQFADDESIYREIQRQLPDITPTLQPLTYALPALARQKREMRDQTLRLLQPRRGFDGYVEIGSSGRYVGALRKALDVREPVMLVNDLAPGYSPVDLMERGGLRKVGTYVPLNDYAPLSAQAVPDHSVDLVSCYIGLHHASAANLDGFTASIARVLRPGGVFILRDHDVRDLAMDAFVSLVHTVFNAGLGVPWADNAAEIRRFRGIAEWVEYLDEFGLAAGDARLTQQHDPSNNILIACQRA